MLFGDLFFGLREAGVKLGLSEWNALMDALKQGLVRPDLEDFYYIGRALLIKSEAHFDIWDQVFGRTFRGNEALKKDVEQLLEWLRDPKQFASLSPEQLAALEMLLPHQRLVVQALLDLIGPIKRYAQAVVVGPLHRRGQIEVGSAFR